MYIYIYIHTYLHTYIYIYIYIEYMDEYMGCIIAASSSDPSQSLGSARLSFCSPPGARRRNVQDILLCSKKQFMDDH